jgi:hypothetical protein
MRRFGSERRRARDRIKIGPGAAHIEISGIDIEGAAGAITLDEAKAEPAPKKNGRLNGNGVSIDGRKPDSDMKERPHHITLRDLRVWACAGGGIAASQCDYLTIEDCTVSGCAWYSTYGCSGISVWQAWNFDKEPGHHIRIRGNRCFDNRQYLPVKPGGKIMDGNGIIIDDSRNTQQGSKLGIYEGRVLIEGNTSFNNGGSGIHAYESDHVDILGNVVWMNNQTPEYTNGQLFVNDARDIRIEGNTIGAVEGKDATNNFRRNDRPENAGIVMEIWSSSCHGPRRRRWKRRTSRRIVPALFRRCRSRSRAIRNPSRRRSSCMTPRASRWRRAARTHIATLSSDWRLLLAPRTATENIRSRQLDSFRPVRVRLRDSPCPRFPPDPVGSFRHPLASSGSACRSLD